MSKAKSIPTSNIGFISQEYIDMVLERNKFLREQLEAKDAQLKIACDALEFIKRRVLVGWEVRKEYIDTKLQEIEALKQIGAGNE